MQDNSSSEITPHHCHNGDCCTIPDKKYKTLEYCRWYLKYGKDVGLTGFVSVMKLLSREVDVPSGRSYRLEIWYLTNKLTEKFLFPSIKKFVLMMIDKYIDFLTGYATDLLMMDQTKIDEVHQIQLRFIDFYKQYDSNGVTLLAAYNGYLRKLPKKSYQPKLTMTLLREVKAAILA